MMYRKQRVTICREGWYYLAVLVFVATGAVMRDINLLMVIAGMMLGPLVYNWRSTVQSLRDLSVGRQLPEGICAGDLLVVDLTVENTRKSRDSWAIVVEDKVCRLSRRSEVESTSASVLFSHVAAGETQRLSYQGRLYQPGRYQFGPLKVTTRFPLGMVQRTITVGKPQTLVVCPRLGRLCAAWNRLHQEAMVGGRQIRQRQSTTMGDFFALRDWRAGDSRRLIHWRTSARRGGLVVRQFEQQREQDLLLLVDLWQPERPSPAQLETVALAVSFAATVVAELCRQGGSRLDIGIAGMEVKLAGAAASMALLSEAMEELAVVEASPHDGLPELMRRAFQTNSQDTTALVISTRPIDLNDAQRFGPLGENFAENLAMRRIVSVDASSDELAEYFQID